jgi:hypothetical protein
VLTLRPGDEARFSTNHFHGTWHVLSDWHGAKVLSHLFWGLSYQRLAGTLVLIDRAHLDPNPFDGASADPIVLMPSPLTALSEKAARQLRLQRHRPEGTVRLQTHGLAKAVAAEREWRELPRGQREYPYIPPSRETVRHIGGVIVFAGGTAALRTWATQCAGLGNYWYHGMDYTDMAGRDGEVQIFRQYRREVSIAKQARAEVLATSPPSNAEALERRIWAHAETVRRRRLPAMESEHSGYPEMESLLKNKNLTLHSFAHSVLVRCPRCDGCARVRCLDPHTAKGVPKVWRLTCPECVYVVERTAPCRKSEHIPEDPVFGLPLWLQERGTWAYNRTHLAFIKAGGLVRG